MTVRDRLADQVWQRCEQLAQCSLTEDVATEGVTRLCATAEHAEALELLRGWMTTAGLQVRLDNAANLIARYPSPNPQAKTLLLGSHQDSVPNGGKYDGALGILLPLSLLSYLGEQGRVLPFHIDLVAFSDEEGCRFSKALLGSSALAGKVDADFLATTDAAGISIAEALTAFGCQPQQIATAAYRADELLGYCEVHIEQGRELEKNDQPLALVRGITGIERHIVTVKGESGHAGTLAMAERRDALAAAAEIIVAFEKLCLEEDLIGVVGRIDNSPNAVNVISGRTLLSLELRSPQDEKRIAGRKKILAQIDAIVQRRRLSHDIEKTYEQQALQCSHHLQALLAAALADCHLAAPKLYSGAGHDCLAIAAISEVAMLFMRCNAGLSHCPAEGVRQDDIALTLQVLERFLQRLTTAVTADAWR